MQKLYFSIHRWGMSVMMASVLAAASYASSPKNGDAEGDLLPHNPAYSYLHKAQVPASSAPDPAVFIQSVLQEAMTSPSPLEAFARVGIKTLSEGLKWLDHQNHTTFTGVLLRETLKTYGDNLVDCLSQFGPQGSARDEYFRSSTFEDWMGHEDFYKDALQLAKFSTLAYADAEKIKHFKLLDRNELDSLPDFSAADLIAYVKKTAPANVMQALDRVSMKTRKALVALESDIKSIKRTAPLVQDAQEGGWSMNHVLRSTTGSRLLGGVKEADFGYVLHKELSEGAFEIVVAIRGTYSAEDALTDLQSTMVPHDRGAGRVHQGFLESAKALAPGVEATLRELRKTLGHEAYAQAKIRLTGHSLGGALASLTAYHLAIQCPELLSHDVGTVTFGAPVIGDQAFVTDFHEHVKHFAAVAQKGDPVTVVKGHFGRDTYQSMGNIVRVPTNFADPHGLKGYMAGVQNLIDKAPTSLLDTLKETMFSNSLEGLNVSINATRAFLTNPEQREKAVRLATDLAQKFFPKSWANRLEW